MMHRSEGGRRRCVRLGLAGASRREKGGAEIATSSRRGCPDSLVNWASAAVPAQPQADPAVPALQRERSVLSFPDFGRSTNLAHMRDIDRPHAPLYAMA